MQGFHHSALIALPAWAGQLKAPYWRVRVESRNKSLRRKSYRHIEKIKLELVELGHDVELINAICRYLSNLRQSSANEVIKLLNNPNPQMTLPLCVNYLT